MSTEIGYFTPKQAERVWRNTLAFEKQPAIASASDRQFIQSSILFVNRSGFTIPPYGCIQIAGTEEIAGRNYLVVKRPIQYSTAVIGPFLFNNDREVPDDDFGTAQMGPIYRAISDGGTYSVGTRIGPLADSYDVGKGCLYTFCGDDDLFDDCVRLIACETPLLAIAGSGGIPANSSAEVTAKQPASGNWTSGSVTYTAWTPTATPIAANATVIIFPVDAKWVAVEIC
jgi:hypothetical protein